jgi:single-strand DNA-binding protein
MNKIIITGYLGQDPEMQTLSNGMEKCRFTVGVSRRVKKDAPKKTDWFNCDAWGATGAFVKTWFKKGSGITVSGRMESSQSGKDGEKRTYWSLNVDDVEFPMKGGDKPAAAEPAPEVDAASGMEKVDTAELPF